MAKEKRQWTRKELEEESVASFPHRLYPFRRRKGESETVWKYRALKMVDEGRIDLTPKKKKRVGGSDPLLKRKPSTLRGVERMGVDGGESAMRIFSAPPSYPLLDAMKTRTERREEEEQTEDSWGLFSLRREMHFWVDESWDLKIEEARCDLMCLACPGGLVLACATDNLGSAKEDGVDLAPFLFGGES